MVAQLTHYARILSIVTLLVVPVPRYCCAQTPEIYKSGFVASATTPQAVLLKKSDRVMTGFVRLNGNFYEIEIADQSRVSIPRDQVEFVGENIEAIYEFKCRDTSRWKSGDHYKLTRWCIQHNLLRQAMNHYTVVEAAIEGHPEYMPALRQLGTELEQKILSDEKFRAYAGLPPLPGAASDANAAMVGKNRNAKDQAVSTASADETSATSLLLIEHPEIGMRFRERVQPILINRCSQAACHGAASHNALRLLEPIGNTSARTSTENLKSALQWIRNDKSGSPALLNYATKPHGLQREPGLSLSETDLIEELKQWIRFAENPIVPAVASRPAPLPATPPAKLPALTPGSSQLRPVNPNNPGASSGIAVEFPAGTARPSTAEIDALDAQLNQILAREKPAAPNAKPQQDPFDPAPFNSGK